MELYHGQHHISGETSGAGIGLDRLSVPIVATVSEPPSQAVPDDRRRKIAALKVICGWILAPVGVALTDTPSQLHDSWEDPISQGGNMSCPSS